MSKKKNTVETAKRKDQVQKKEVKAPKAAPEVKEEKKVDEKKTVEEKKPEQKSTQISVIETDELFKKLQGKLGDDLDRNHQVDLLNLSALYFKKDPNAEEKYGKTVVDNMNAATASGIIIVMSNEAAFGTSPFAVRIRKQCLPMLKEASAAMGIPFDDKLLPAPDKDGVVEVPTTAVKPSGKTKKQLLHEKEISENIPELDVNKILESENPTDSIKSALEYYFTLRNGRSMHESILEAINLIKNFRVAQAKKEGNEDIAASLESYSTGNWINDIFELISPTLLYKGIGSGLVNAATTTETVIHPFIILRDIFKDKKTGDSALSDSDIAVIARSIAIWVAKNNIKNNEKEIAKLDAKKDKKQIDAYKNANANYQKVIDMFTDPSFDFVDNMAENLVNGEPAEKSRAVKIASKIGLSYYGKAVSIKQYKNLAANLQQYAGIITNLFCDPLSQNSKYSISNLTELEEYTKEELEQMKKEELQKSKKESKKD